MFLFNFLSLIKQVNYFVYKQYIFPKMKDLIILQFWQI